MRDLARRARAAAWRWLLQRFCPHLSWGCEGFVAGFGAPIARRRCVRCELPRAEVIPHPPGGRHV
jgi:hypothetical protein